MEKVCLRKSLVALKAKGVVPDILITDQSLSIAKFMTDEYPEILHHLDPWHRFKNTKNELWDASKYSNGDNLLRKYINPIMNHLWNSIGYANGDGEIALEVSLSALLHSIGIHRWYPGNLTCIILEEMFSKCTTKKQREKLIKYNPENIKGPIQNFAFKNVLCCLHRDDIDSEREYEYMDPLSKDYAILLRVLTKPLLLDAIPRMSPVNATSSCENLNSISSQSYRRKSRYYNLTGFEHRSMLAVLHYNNLVVENPEIMGEYARKAKARGSATTMRARRYKPSNKWKEKILVESMERAGV